MAQRIVTLFMTFGLILCLVTALPAGKASAKEGEYKIQKVKVAIDDSNKKVTIQGVTTNGGSDVTIIVTNPDGVVDYLNQEASQQDGKFSFTYVPSSTWDGNYELSIGGDKIEAPYGHKFKVKGDKPGNGNNPGKGDKNSITTGFNYLATSPMQAFL